jgi:hypothetical protein
MADTLSQLAEIQQHLATIDLYLTLIITGLCVFSPLMLTGMFILLRRKYR